MKKYSILIAFLALAMIAARLAGVWAQASPTATPSSDKAKQIEDLKDRLATKVAELTQTQKRAIYGVVKTISISSATIETATKDVKIELVDSLTIFQNLKGKRTKLTLDDLAKGDTVTVFGDYEVTLDLLKASVIFIQDPLPVRVAGVVTATDSSQFTLTVQPGQGPAVTVDIERTTKTMLWDGTSLTKSGFSKIQIGARVHVVGSAVAKKENRISAARILDLGDLSGTPRPTEAATPTPTPKQTPTPKSTPTPTQIPTPTP